MRWDLAEMCTHMTGSGLLHGITAAVTHASCESRNTSSGASLSEYLYCYISTSAERIPDVQLIGWISTTTLDGKEFPSLCFASISALCPHCSPMFYPPVLQTARQTVHPRDHKSACVAAEQSCHSGATDATTVRRRIPQRCRTHRFHYAHIMQSTCNGHHNRLLDSCSA